MSGGFIYLWGGWMDVSSCCYGWMRWSSTWGAREAPQMVKDSTVLVLLGWGASEVWWVDDLDSGSRSLSSRELRQPRAKGVCSSIRSARCNSRQYHSWRVKKIAYEEEQLRTAILELFKAFRIIIIPEICGCCSLVMDKQMGSRTFSQGVASSLIWRTQRGHRRHPRRINISTRIYWSDLTRTRWKTASTFRCQYDLKYDRKCFTEWYWIIYSIIVKKYSLLNIS